ncbi:MAG: AAA family ATPase [Kofleriaceae bacterium]|nr:AAA family ATPase [Kofleriaceae bacterium]
MTKPSFRIYWIEHARTEAVAVGDEPPKRSGTLLRRWELLLDSPPPSAMGETDDEVTAELERQLLVLRAAGEDLERYLWTETFEARRVEVEVNPETSVGGLRAIGVRDIPLRVGVAVCETEDGAFRAILPRVGWSLVVESLDQLATIVRQVVFAALLGSRSAWIYDLRREGEERVDEWRPPLADQLTRAGRKPAASDVDGVLPQIAEDWVEKAERRRLAPVVGPSAPFELILPLLQRPRPPSLLLVGPPGSGKTALVRRLARYLLDHGRGRKGAKARLWASSADRIVAGMVYLGMWQERCLEIARALSQSRDFLHVDRLTDLIRPQSDGAAIADLLAPAIIAGEIAIIAEASEAELEKCRRRNPELVDALTVIRVDALAPSQVVPLVGLYQQRKDGAPEIGPQAARRLVSLLGAFRRDVGFPGKLFTFLDWWYQDPGRPTGAALPRDVVAAYSRWSGMPVEIIADEQPATSRDVAAALQRGVIGQDHACAISGRVVARLKAGLDDPERPVGTLLFIGPTGVGKTELAKQLARYLFGSAERLVRVDMSEYAAPGSAQRLLEAGAGAPSLAEKVRAQPLSVVLFDEIEKAHPDVFDLLLGVLGEGRLTDALGRPCDFRMTVIVMTSNLGAREARATGFAGDGQPDYLGAVRRHFRPEWLGRIDHVVAFRPLAPADVARIVELELDKVRRRAGLVQRRLTLTVSPAACAVLAEAGFDARMGARPLRRVIEERVVTPVAVQMSADPELRDATLTVIAAGELAPGEDPGDRIVL